MRTTLLSLTALLLIIAPCFAGEIVFEDDFQDELGDGWTWRQEVPEHWRLSDQGLQIRVKPGNMWGGDRDVDNILLRDAPELTDAPLEVAVTIDHQPTEQYEQADLVWFYDDHNMVKLGPERVDGQLSVVMGVMKDGGARTLAIIPLERTPVRVRLTVVGNEIRGEYQLHEEDEWRHAGATELPAEDNPQISFQCYQGTNEAEHWATFSNFHIRRIDD